MNVIRRAFGMCLLLTFASHLPAQVIEEIIVTAQKKAEAVTDVPITMTALGGSDIKDLRITDAMDVEAFVTNIDIKGTLGGTNPAITVRGVGLNDFNANNNPAVGVYVDEVFLVSAGMLEFSTFDLERVEVLKGPQGTLYGRNTNGGAINYFTARPSFEPDGYVTVGAGDYGLKEIEAAYGNAINEDWAFRVAGRWMDRDDPYVDNLIGDDFDGSDLSTGRISLLFEGENVNFLTSLTVGSESRGFQPFKNRGFIDPLDPNSAPCATAASGNPAQDFSCTSLLLGVNRTFFNPDVETFPNDDFEDATYADNVPTSSTDTDSLLWNARLDYDLNETTTITSVTSYADFDREYADSVFGSLVGYRYFDSGRDETIEQFTQELRISVINETIEWTTGVFYSSDEVKSTTLINAEDSLATLYDIQYDQETTAYALFTQMEYILSEKWSIEAGLRWSSEERDYVGGTTDLNPWDQSVVLYLPLDFGGFGLPFDFAGPLPLTAGTVIDTDEDDTSGRLGVNYRPNDDWLIYANVSSGFKSGIVFSDITFVPEEMGPLDSETIEAFEIGFKATLLEGALQVNGAYFRYDYEDIQTQVPSPLGLTFTNAEEADISGVEFDLNWLIGDYWSLRAGVSTLDTEFDDPGLDGNELPNAPELQYNAILRYDRPLSSDLNLAVQVDMKHTDEMYKEATNNPLALTDDYTTYNARIAVSGADDKWEVALWGKNLGNEDYIEHVFIVDFFGITADLYNTPRTWGGTFTYNF